jgi:hypothetical protein
MSIEILGRASDLRTNTPVIYAKVPIKDYLALVGEDFADFEIQRRREKHKAYKRMRQDVIEGALLPSITLAVRSELVDALREYIEQEDDDGLREALSLPRQVHILDGLQRTYILKDLASEGTEFHEGQTVLVEFWLERDIRNLIYRIIVLNAGQKPMSMRHQIELLFITVKERLEAEIERLEIFTEREGNRRTRSRKYPLDRIAAAYQCFVTSTPEVQRENIVAQRLVEEDILSSTEDELADQFDSFTHHLSIFAQLDDEICRVYVKDDEGRKPIGTFWFGSDNVMNSFFAAVADFGTNAAREQRVEKACAAWLELLRGSAEGSDPMALSILQELIQGFNTRRVNVGFATRKLLFNALKEYFRDEGETSFQQCWVSEAE